MHPQLTDDSLGRLARLADDAAANPDHWPGVAGAIAQAFGANGAVLFTPTPDADRSLAVTTGIASDAMPLYASEWVTEDPWLQGAGAVPQFQSAGHADFGRTVVPVEELRASRFYGDFARPHDLEALLCLKVCDDRDAVAPITHLSMFRAPNTPDFGETERQALTALWPRLQHAVHAYWLLHHARHVERLAAEALDAVPHPALVLRADAHIEHVNATARDVMARHTGIVTGFGRLLRIGDVTAAELAASPAPGFAAIAVGGRLRRVPVFVTTLADTAPYASAWPQARHLVTLVWPEPDPSPSTPAWLQSLRRHHGLTFAEARVLGLLATGQDAGTMAGTLGVSLATVRSHLRALFDKTGCRRQAELVRLVLGA